MASWPAGQQASQMAGWCAGPMAGLLAVCLHGRMASVLAGWCADSQMLNMLADLLACWSTGQIDLWLGILDVPLAIDRGAGRSCIPMTGKGSVLPLVT